MNLTKCRAKGLEIVGHMRERADDYKFNKYHLNYGILATPAEGLAGSFLREWIASVTAQLRGVTDREFYTNSFPCACLLPN